MLLVTTPLEETWGHDEKLLFLGEWCKIYDRKPVWSNRLSEVLPYHWDDRDKLRNDFDYLRRLNDDLLIELTDVLNEIHHVEYSERYWRIVIGYWLNVFTAVLFDRWEMIHLAAASDKVTKTIILNISPLKLVANDSDEFLEFVFSDYWNHAIYAKILEYIPSISLIYKDQDFPDKATLSTKITRSESLTKKLIKTVLSKLSKLTVRPTEPFIISSYLPFLKEAQLQILLGSLPKYFAAPSNEIFSYSASMREWQMPVKEDGVSFDRFVRLLLPELMPKVFIEGYKTTTKKTSALGWPKNPKLILTANLHYNNEGFKIWTAGNLEQGSRFITIDHGGFGLNAFNGGIKYQLEVADLNLSWGWEDNTYPHVKPIGIVKTLGKRIKYKQFGEGLMVLVAMPRYSFDIRAMAISSQVLDYFEDQYRFYGMLPNSIRSLFRIRLYVTDYNWFQKERWLDRFPDVRLDDFSLSVFSLMKKSRLFVSTYNATTYLESLSLNFPTIIFWNPRHWEIKKEAVPYFQFLKDVGIFHETPESASSKVCEVWNDIPAWWHQKDVQEARRYFCDRFAKKADLQTLKKALLSVN